MKLYRILLLGLALVLSVQTGWAQTSRKEQRKIEKAEQKRLKEEERLRNQEQVKAMVKDQTYVLEATTLMGRYGQQAQVSPTTNFVLVAGNQIIIQTANNVGIGYNGLGGITINGTISSHEITENKNSFSVTIQFKDPVLGHSSVNLDIQKSGFARARVLSNWGARISFQGQFVALENTRVYQGQPII